MTKLNPKTKQQILARLLRQEQQKKIEPFSKTLPQKSQSYKQERPLINRKVVIKELVKVTVVSFICLAIILTAWYLDLTTDILSNQAQKITQILHL